MKLFSFLFIFAMLWDGSFEGLDVFFWPSGILTRLGLCGIKSKADI